MELAAKSRNQIEPSKRSVGETEFANGVAAMFASGALGRPRACAGIVGRADLTLGSRVEPVLLAHLRAGGDRFRGVRHITSWDADTRLNNPDYPSPPALLMDRTFREGIAVLARLGLSFDAMVCHPQLDEVADLAGAFPDLPIVLNHCGVPMRIGAYQGRHDEIFAHWSASLRRLAAHESVSVKGRRDLPERSSHDPRVWFELLRAHEVALCALRSRPRDHVYR